MAHSLSANRIKRLGQALREDRLDTGSESWSEYVEFLANCDTYRAKAEERVRSCLDSDVVVTGRTKSTDTLREKLIRTPSIQLPSIDDVVGIRVVGDFTLTQQDQIAEAIRGEFGGDVRTRDRRQSPSSGYRALHVIIKAGGVRVEIQIRTRLQAEWADLFERLADRWGRQIRYGLAPDPDSHGDSSNREELIRKLQELSLDYVADYEEGLDRSIRDTATEIIAPPRQVKNRSRADIVRAMRLKEMGKEIPQLRDGVVKSLEDMRRALLHFLEALANEADEMP